MVDEVYLRLVFTAYIDFSGFLDWIFLGQDKIFLVLESFISSCCFVCSLTGFIFICIQGVCLWVVGYQDRSECCIYLVFARDR